MGSKEDFVLYSDGGGEKTSAAAAACIVESKSSGQRFNIVTYLGPGTNNEAEIIAGLLGFSFLSVLGEKAISLRWIADSEYVLKSATSYIHAWQGNGWKTASKSPVKNQGLWKTFLLLSNGIKIEPEHVRGHTGHPENEACDSASTWAMANGKQILDLQGPALFVEIDGERGEESWLLIDGRRFLAELRGEGSVSPAEEESLGLVSSMSSAGISGFDCGQISAKPRDYLGPVLADIRRVISSCGDKTELSSLAVDLKKVLAKHEKMHRLANLAVAEPSEAKKKQKKRC